MRKTVVGSISVVLMLAASGTLISTTAPRSVFSKDNIVAWAIVPFDATERGPDERAQMLQRLGIKLFAYDWRDRHIPTFDEEADALQRHGIKLHAFWLTSGPNPQSEKNVQIVLDFLKRRSPGTQVWYVFVPPEEFDSLGQEAKVKMASAAVRYIAERAKEFHSKVGLYNNLGWYLEPENLLAIINYLKLDNVGMVYNFQHSRTQIERFPELFPMIVPYLLAINLNGMRKEEPGIPLPKFLPIGTGDREVEMMKIIQAANYRGVISIPDGRSGFDAEVILKESLDGLQRVLKQIGDEEALRTY